MCVSSSFNALQCSSKFDDEQTLLVTRPHCFPMPRVPRSAPYHIANSIDVAMAGVVMVRKLEIWTTPAIYG